MKLTLKHIYGALTTIAQQAIAYSVFITVAYYIGAALGWGGGLLHINAILCSICIIYIFGYYTDIRRLTTVNGSVSLGSNILEEPGAQSSREDMVIHISMMHSMMLVMPLLALTNLTNLHWFVETSLILLVFVPFPIITYLDRNMTFLYQDSILTVRLFNRVIVRLETDELRLVSEEVHT